jgi:membrane fusion protein, multidrug efflux system
LLFTIDPRQYEIRLAQANAQLETATAHLALADQQLARAEQLVRTSAGTVQNVDQRSGRSAGRSSCCR